MIFRLKIITNKVNFVLENINFYNKKIAEYLTSGIINNTFVTDIMKNLKTYKNKYNNPAAICCCCLSQQCYGRIII